MPAMDRTLVIQFESGALVVRPDSPDTECDVDDSNGNPDPRDWKTCVWREKKVSFRTGQDVENWAIVILGTSPFVNRDFLFSKRGSSFGIIDRHAADAEYKFIVNARSTDGSETTLDPILVIRTVR